MLKDFVAKWPHPFSPKPVDRAPSDLAATGAPSDMAGTGAPSNMAGTGAPSNVAGTEAPRDMAGSGQPSDMAGSGAQPTEDGRPKRGRVRRRGLKTVACVAEVPAPPEAPHVPAATQCQEDLLAAEAARQAAGTGQVSPPVSRDDRLDNMPQSDPKSATSVDGCDLKAHQAAHNHAAAIGHHVATCRPHIRIAQLAAAFNRPFPEHQQPAILHMDTGRHYGMYSANQFMSAAARDSQGACGASDGSTSGGGAWPAKFGISPEDFDGWPGNFGTAPGTWPGNFGNWPSPWGGWPNSFASQLPQIPFNSDEPLPASSLEWAGVAPAATGLPSPQATPLLGISGNSPELAPMQAPAVRTQEGERFLETIVEEAASEPTCMPPRLAGLPGPPSKWLEEIHGPSPEQAWMPVEEQGETGTINGSGHVDDGISSDDSDTGLDEAMKSAVSEYLRPHSPSEEVPTG